MRNSVFLDETNLVEPWTESLSLIARHATCAKTGRQPIELTTLLRFRFVQQWFTLADPAFGDALFETPLYRDFLGLASVERY